MAQLIYYLAKSIKATLITLEINKIINIFSKNEKNEKEQSSLKEEKLSTLNELTELKNITGELKDTNSQLSNELNLSNHIRMINQATSSFGDRDSKQDCN